MMPSTTQSSFASGKTIDGLLPPSSSETGTMRSEAARMMSLPTSVEPVKDSLLTIGWRASAAPHSSPNPVSTLSTPGGRNSWHTSASSSTPSGASSAAFKTSVLPAQSAGPILRAARSTGAFHGMMAAYHAERLAPRVAQDMFTQGDRLALEFPAQAAEVADNVDRRLRLGARLGAERIPGLERDR